MWGPLIYEYPVTPSPPPLRSPDTVGGGRGQWLGGHHGDCGARAYNGSLGGRAPAGSRGRAPGQGGQGGEAPLKLKAFWSLHVQRSRQIEPLSTSATSRVARFSTTKYGSFLSVDQSKSVHSMCRYIIPCMLLSAHKFHTSSEHC